MQNLGHKVSYLTITNKLKPNQIHVEDIKKAKPDMVWLLSPFYIAYNCITKEAMSYIKDKKIPIGWYGTYNVSIPYPEWLDKVWKKIDFLFPQSREMADWCVEKGLNAHYMPLGFYPSQYYKTDTSKKLDVSFMGRCQTSFPPEQDKRAKYLQALKDYNIVIYGGTFEDRLKGIKIKSYRGHDRQRKVYGKTKINLELPFVNGLPDFYRDKYHAKNRFFEIPATGNFLLTIKSPEFLDIFGEDAVGYYDDSIESLRENIDKYLKEKKLRRKMAKTAYKIAQEKHSYQHRFNEMFKIVEG